MSKELSERLTETLFDIYFHRMFELGEIVFFAPSQVKEKELGYDGNFVGPEAKWELFLQFKQPTYLKRGDYFRFKIDQTQLKTLHDLSKELPPVENHVFYVAPSYLDIRELDNQQRVSSHPCCFLNRYILIKAASLPLNTSYVFFTRTFGRRCPCDYFIPHYPSYKLSTDYDPNNIYGSRILDPSDYLILCDGIEKFKNREIGASIAPAQKNIPAHYQIDDTVFSSQNDPSRRSLKQFTDELVNDKTSRSLIIRLNEES